MANPFQMFKTDPTIETTTGVILDYGDFRCRVARAGGANKRYTKLIEARMKPHSRLLAVGKMDDDVATRILVEVFSETVILDMDVLDKEKSTIEAPVYIPGILCEDGTIIEDNYKNRVEFFLKLEEMFLDVRKQANDFTQFLEAVKEDIVKN